jgi:hypothetical protein
MIPVAKEAAGRPIRLAPAQRQKEPAMILELLMNLGLMAAFVLCLTAVYVVGGAFLGKELFPQSVARSEMQPTPVARPEAHECAKPLMVSWNVRGRHVAVPVRYRSRT